MAHSVGLLAKLHCGAAMVLLYFVIDFCCVFYALLAPALLCQQLTREVVSNGLRHQYQAVKPVLVIIVIVHIMIMFMIYKRQKVNTSQVKPVVIIIIIVHIIIITITAVKPCG